MNSTTKPEFPLYDCLKRGKTKKTLSRDDKVKLIENIHNLDQDGQHKVLALILYNQMDNSNEQYEPAQNMTIALSTISNELLVILEMFCELHKQTMKDTMNREKIPF